MPHLSINSPLGPLTVFEEAGALVALDFGRAPDGGASPLLDEAAVQLEAFFDGKRRAFRLPLAPAGSAFQRAVWAAIEGIPYGETRTYGEIARQLASAARAVGAACAANPIPIVIPCHRVLGAAGRLTGYSGGEGPETKRALLVLEGARLF